MCIVHNVCLVDDRYADDTCRGGVLEPEGTVEVKFRRKAIEELMARTDPVYAGLLAKVSTLRFSFFFFTIFFL